jgi:hypothetical protein
VRHCYGPRRTCCRRHRCCRAAAPCVDLCCDAGLSSRAAGMRAGARSDGNVNERQRLVKALALERLPHLQQEGWGFGGGL